jgi:hypothetical protein
LVVVGVPGDRATSADAAAGEFPGVADVPLDGLVAGSVVRPVSASDAAAVVAPDVISVAVRSVVLPVVATVSRTVVGGVVASVDDEAARSVGLVLAGVGAAFDGRAVRAALAGSVTRRAVSTTRSAGAGTGAGLAG